MRRGTLACVVVCTPWRLNLGSRRARTPAITAGKYSGLHPAITALIASFSTVATPFMGGTSPTNRVSREAAGLDHRSDQFLRWRDDGQPIRPPLFEAVLNSLVEAFYA